MRSLSSNNNKEKMTKKKKKKNMKKQIMGWDWADLIGSA